MKKEISLEKANRLINHGPTILVSSHDGEKPNIMTAAWQTPVSKQPLLVAVSIAPGRLTHRFIEATREFVINIPSHRLLYQTHGCGTVSGRDADKFEKFGLTPVPARTIGAPLVDECIAHLECTLYASYTVGDHTLFVGEVLTASVEEDLFDEFLKVEKPEAKTIHHLGSNMYTLPDRSIKSTS